MGKKILVTGSNGQLGMELRQLAPAHPSYSFIFTTREQMPLEDPAAIHALIDNLKPDYLVNCAAYTAVDRAESDRPMAFLVNGEAPGTMAAACARNNAVMIHISTDYVFNGQSDRPYRESDATDPVNLYGASKLEGEKNVLRELPSSIIIRTAWVYSEFGKNFVRTMLRLMNEKEQIGVVSDQYGTPTYAADLASAVISIIQTLGQDSSPVPGHSGIFHFSNEGRISWYEFAVAIAKLSGTSCRVNPISTKEFPTPAKRPSYSVLDKTKITREFGIVPPHWHDSLEKCIARILQS